MSAEPATDTMNKIFMYCTAWCPYCIRAERLLKKKGAEFDKIQVEGKPDLFEEMIEKTGRETVPQIYIGDFHVGGFDDLVELDMEGRLDELLADL